MREDNLKEMLHTDQAGLYDLGDGIAALVFEAADGTIGPQTARWAAEALKTAEAQVKGLVVTARGADFCTGQDLYGIQALTEAEKWEELEQLSRDYQSLTGVIQAYSKPVVTLLKGKTLDFGAELALCSPFVLAGEDLVMGFQTGRTGLSPLGGGLAALTQQTYRIGETVPGHDIVPFLKKSLQLVTFEKLSENGADAQAKGLLKQEAAIVETEGLLERGKRKACYLAGEGRLAQAGGEKEMTVSGTTGRAAMEIGAINGALGGFVSPKQLQTVHQIARVLAGGDVPKGTLVSTEQFLKLEREAFVTLCRSNLREVLA